uniref:Metadherin a n=1 Tax=Poecilia formosa TaxID=48698 RepID=A0A096LTN4_POEFO
MAGDLWSFALEKAELLSSRLRELVSSGQGLVRAQFGVDLGLKPELYPSWLILSTAAVGLLLPLLLGASWAAFCGGGGGKRLVGKKRASQVNQGGEETGKASFNIKSVKPEEPKKRNRKKTGDKKTQSNGQPPVVVQEEVKEIVAASKTATPMKAVKVKKPKKKPKTEPKPDVKPVQLLVTSDVKEPDDGAWETKVSNREKRQQRRKDKGSEDSGSPGGDKASKAHVETPAAAATSKKKRGNNEISLDLLHLNVGEINLRASSAWRVEPTVNGGGWSDVPLKAAGQAGSVEGKKWSSIPPSGQYRSQSDPQPWAQESQGVVSGRLEQHGREDEDDALFCGAAELCSLDPLSNSAKLQWANQTIVDDQWSGVKGTAADSSSDWNAPAEHWGNFVYENSSELNKSQRKVSEDEKDTDD